jgi:membrane protease YdiL (CAAX protease family)
MLSALSRSLRQHPLVAYFVLAYTLTWPMQAPLVARAQGWTTLPIPYWLHYPAQFGPCLAALVMTAIVGGRAGLHDLIARATRWRIGIGWGIAAGAPLFLFAVAVLVARLVDGSWADLRLLGAINFLPYLGLWTLPLWFLTNGVGEEVGWRGYALPRLQQGHSALVATLILWMGWAGWHLPDFFYVPTYMNMSLTLIPGFVLGLLAGAILLTWLYNSTGGSLLAVMVWHGTFNYVTASQAGQGTVAMVVSILVMVWAVAMLILAGPARLVHGATPSPPGRELEPARA